MKDKNAAAWLVTALLALALNSVAQTPSAGPSTADLPMISAADAAQHLLKKTEAVYPTMARMARIQGKVVVQATIAEDGHVAGVKAVSGHPILLQSALDAIREWRYQPFFSMGGQARCARKLR